MTTDAIFYFVGIIYVFDVVRELFKLIKHQSNDSIENKDNGIVLSDKMGSSQLMSQATKIKKPKKIEKVIGLLFFAWALVGYFLNLPEKYWFLTDVIVIIISQLFFVAVGLYMVFSSLKNNNRIVAEKEVTPKKMVNIPISEIFLLSELSILVIILLHHFLTN